MGVQRDRSVVLGETATVVALVFGFRFVGAVLRSVLVWFTDSLSAIGLPMFGLVEEVTITAARALDASLGWAGVVLAAGYVYLRVARYRERTTER